MLVYIPPVKYIHYSKYAVKQKIDTFADDMRRHLSLCMFFLALAQFFVFGHMVIPHHNHDLEIVAVEDTDHDSNDCHHHESCISPCTVEQDNHDNDVIAVIDYSGLPALQTIESKPATSYIKADYRAYNLIIGYACSGVPLRAPPCFC